MTSNPYASHLSRRALLPAAVLACGFLAARVTTGGEPRLEVRVYEQAGSKKPVPEALVLLCPGSEGTCSQADYTDRRGVALFDNSPTGTFRVRAMVRNCIMVETTIEFPSTDQLKKVELVAPESGLLRITVEAPSESVATTPTEVKLKAVQASAAVGHGNREEQATVFDLGSTNRADLCLRVGEYYDVTVSAPGFAAVVLRGQRVIRGSKTLRTVRLVPVKKP